MRLSWLIGALVALLILPGCGGGGSSSSSGGGGGGGGGGSATLKAVTISPLGPGVAVGGNEQLTATGTFSDNSTKDVTTSCAWTSDTTSVATVGGSTGAVAGVAPGVATITCTNSSVSPAVTASTVVNVVQTATTASLSGPYAFFITNAGTRGQSFIVGSFNANGSGSISSGVEDINASQGSTSGAALTGSYTLFADGRGTLTLKSSAGQNTYAFTLSSDSTKGKIMLLGSGAVEVGTFERQDNTQFASGLSGNYTFLVGGVDGKLATGSSTLQNPEVMVGQGSIASSVVTGNSLDVNDNGTASPGAFSGSVTASPDANGRGTLKFTNLTTFPAAVNFAYYIVSASKVLLIQTDPQGGTLPTIPALAGTAEKQNFTIITLSGTSYVMLLERSASPGIFASAGQWAFKAANALGGEMDVNNLGTTNSGTLANTSKFGTPDVNGRGTVNLSGPNGIGARTYVFYVISNGTATDKMYVMETDNKINGGIAELQTSVALPTPPAGAAFALSLAQLATGGSDSSILARLPDLAGGNGIAVSNAATSNVAAQSSAVYSGTITASGTNPDASGRGTGTLGSGNNNTYGFYVIDANRLIVFGTKSALTNFQAPDGVLEVQ